jgi:glycosyltransferase involved in cell wall biosynthesis
MPVYNGELYVGAAIDSLLVQTFSDFELIISDNGSTDRTQEICHDAARLDERIRYLRNQQNRGAAWNYNRVFTESTGRLFRWAAHDDLCTPKHLERCVDTLTTGLRSIVLAYPRAVVVDENGDQIGEYDEPCDLSHPAPHVRLARLTRHLVKGNMLFGLVRREAMVRTRLHGAFASGDWVLIAELALQGPFVEVPERLFVRRFHPEMSRLANRTLEDMAEFFAPGSGRDAGGEFSRLFREFLVAIRRAPLDPVERARALGTFVPLFVARHKRALGREAWQALTHSGGGRSDGRLTHVRA